MYFFMGLGHAEEARPESLKAAEVWLLKARQSAEAQNAPASVKGPIYRAPRRPLHAAQDPDARDHQYQSAKSIDETDLDTRMALGDAYYKGALYNDALGEYQAVVDADPDYAEGYLKLGKPVLPRVVLDPQRIFKSIETLETLLKKDPNNLEGKALLAQAYFRKGGAEGKQKAASCSTKSRRRATASCRRPPGRIRGVMQYENGQYENAIASFKQKDVRSRRSTSSDSRRLLAASPWPRRRTRSRRRRSTTPPRRSTPPIIEADSTTADARKAQFERARIRYGNKDYAAAITEFQRLYSLDPKSAEALYYVGLSQRQLGNDAAGIESMKKALEIEPESLRSWWIQLGSGYVKQKADPGAKDAFQHAADDTTKPAGRLRRSGSSSSATTR
jgi:tetratricopeptide (TPR) repeat protein